MGAFPSFHRENDMVDQNPDSVELPQGEIFPGCPVCGAELRYFKRGGGQGFSSTSHTYECGLAVYHSTTRELPEYHEGCRSATQMVLDLIEAGHAQNLDDIQGTMRAMGATP